MICSKCGAEVPEGAVFCGVCGEPVDEGERVEKVEAEVVGSAAPKGAGGKTEGADRCRPPRREASAGPENIDATPYIIFSILATLFCFMPTGIPAIVYAARIDSAELRGDFAAAAEAARKSKMWCIISAVVFAAAIVLSILLAVAIFAGTMGIVAAVGASAFH